MWALILAASCVCAASENCDGMTARLIKAVDESTSGLSVYESKALGEEPLSTEEVASALAYVRAHQEASSYQLLLALEKQAPESYAQLSDAIRVEFLRRPAKTGFPKRFWLP